MNEPQLPHFDRREVSCWFAGASGGTNRILENKCGLHAMVYELPRLSVLFPGDSTVDRVIALRKMIW
jgi:hypothetical protein